jgi:hypothetical protein
MQFADVVALGAVVLLLVFVALTVRNDGAISRGAALRRLAAGLPFVGLYLVGLVWGAASALMDDGTRMIGWLVLAAVVGAGVGLLNGSRAASRRAHEAFAALTGVAVAAGVYAYYANGYRLAIPWTASGARSVTQDLDLVLVGAVVAYVLASLLARRTV